MMPLHYVRSCAVLTHSMHPRRPLSRVIHFSTSSAMRGAHTWLPGSESRRMPELGHRWGDTLGSAHAGRRTRVTSMGGLYDAATLRALT